MIATVPKENLLVWDLKEGWEPLCKFLNKPIPDQERKQNGSLKLASDWLRASSDRHQLDNFFISKKPIPHDNKTGDAEYIQKNFLEAPLFKNVRYHHSATFYGVYFLFRLEIQ